MTKIEKVSYLTCFVVDAIRQAGPWVVIGCVIAVIVVVSFEAFVPVFALRRKEIELDITR